MIDLNISEEERKALITKAMEMKRELEETKRAMEEKETEILRMQKEVCLLKLGF